MGTYLFFQAADPEAVNALFQSEFDTDQVIVSSRSSIEADIAYIKADPTQADLAKQLNTMEDWNRVFSSWAEGRGQVKVSGGYHDDRSHARVVSFVLRYPSLFTSVSGVSDALDIQEAARWHEYASVTTAIELLKIQMKNPDQADTPDAWF